MSFDSALNEKFEQLYYKLKHKGEIEKKELDELIKIITLEKRIDHEYKSALEKIKRLKNLLNKEMPLILKYREAAIYFEYKDVRNLEEAETLFLELVEEKDFDSNIKDRCHFFLCKIYLEKAKMEEDNEEIKKNLEEAGDYLNYLNGKARINKLDDSVLSWLWEVQEQIKDFNKEKDFILVRNSTDEILYFKTIEEANSHLNNFDMILNFHDNSVIINGELQEFFENDMKVLALLSKGSELEYFKLENDLELDNTTQQRISRMKKELKKLFPDKANTIVTKTEKGKYRISPLVSVAILLNRKNDNFQSIDYSLKLGFERY